MLKWRRIKFRERVRPSSRLDVLVAPSSKWYELIVVSDAVGFYLCVAIAICRARSTRKLDYDFKKILSVNAPVSLSNG